VQARHLIDRVFCIAKAEHTVAAIIFPNDIQEAFATEPEHARGAIHTGTDFSQPIISRKNEKERIRKRRRTTRVHVVCTRVSNSLKIKTSPSSPS
jgi:hypothetical protein